MNSKIIQIIEISDYNSIRNPVVFDAYSKDVSYAFFKKLFQSLYNEGYVYYENLNYKKTEPYTYNEEFLKIQNGELCNADSFEDCDFYYCTFYTADLEQEDQGIVCFCTFSILNSGYVLYGKH